VSSPDGPPVRRVRGLLGETMIEDDTPDAVARGTRAMLEQLLALHGVEPGQVLSAVFTVTPDLTCAFPAATARAMGWTDVPLLCVSAIPVPGAPTRRVQALLHVER
jgi:chorismate mutase